MAAVTDARLRRLVAAIVAGDHATVEMMLADAPDLAVATFREGATRKNAQAYFLHAIGRYLVAGDTALHIAAAAYRESIVRALIEAGAQVSARNRHGATPLHSAAAGSPNATHWNPRAQAATIRSLVNAGVDPNGTDKRGVTPLHIAVRTRCAVAVRTLLEYGADAKLKNKSGSTPLLLAQLTTGRGGSGSPEAREQQREILEILAKRGA